MSNTNKQKPVPKKVTFRVEDGWSHNYEGEEPITTHKLPCSDISEHDYCFSNGRQYRHPVDRFPRGEYDVNFSERDRLLDSAIQKGESMRRCTNLWHIYDDAVLNYELEPINPYEWLFNHATLSEHSIIISKPTSRVLLVKTAIYGEYYDFIHGHGKQSLRYGRPVR